MKRIIVLAIIFLSSFGVANAFDFFGLFNKRAQQWADIDFRNDPQYKNSQVATRKMKWLRSESQDEFEERMRKAYFYRVKANYTHKDKNTGEIEELNFDVVATCTTVLMNPEGTTYSRETPVPSVFGKATNDGGVAFLRVLDACHMHGFKRPRDIPDDLTPFVFWYDDVHKIGQGIGFASEDAYESPIAPLQFKGASLTEATFEEWQAWREKQLAEFKPIGILQSLWGVSPNGNQPEIQQGSSLDWPNRRSWRGCQGYRQRIVLPNEVQERVKELWPNGAPEFWFKEDAGLDRNQVRKLLEIKDGKNRGFSTVHKAPPDYLIAGSLISPNNGIITRSGGGAIGRGRGRPNDARYHGEFYPYIYIFKSEEGSKSVRQVVQHIDFRPEMKGFTNCGGPTNYGEIKLDELGFADGKGTYIGKKRVWNADPDGEPHLINRWGSFWLFEGTEYVWVR